LHEKMGEDWITLKNRGSAIDRGRVADKQLLQWFTMGGSETKRGYLPGPSIYFHLSESINYINGSLFQLCEIRLN
jgi:hypothetical protein